MRRALSDLPDNHIEDRTAPHKLAEHYRLGLTSNQHLDVFGSKESLHLAHRGQVCQGVPFLGSSYREETKLRGGHEQGTAIAIERAFEDADALLSLWQVE